ncbi:hypothetical protein PPYR_05762 [Photinus pyralis]|uniref:Rho-GAP domain-containing protein n=1 Tax=Photinus pyralis TaxID=7054 RepID=A0A1Y1MZY2_PHOPY|nr:ralA-binding protein 1 isoform X2 [Photinus pyralis]KAB0801408.1 hypothetical protein PPYR_05762 [Photinus pyralis]
MDFESPDVMKDFPGLYASDIHKTKSNDPEYSDDAEKVTKKDILIGKRKDKKDKKDKERGYAALEGESSAEESYEVSPSKSKKSKSFKFPTKSKEKREKSREKDKEFTEKKKEKDKRTEKKIEKDKEKCKVEKKEKKVKSEDWCDIAEVLPIFGVNLKLAIEHGRCHDGIDLPVPVRACIEYVEDHGLTFENVYKVSGPKSKVLHLKKLYNQREHVNLSDYDVPTVTSLLKMFLRDLPEPVFTADLLIRFEEAGAILNVAVREKHLKILVGNLPETNRLLLSWITVHLYNVTLNERLNKMSPQNIALCLSSTLQTSQRLLSSLLFHCPALFPNTVLEHYVYPLTSSSQLPDDPELMEQELLKQESLLAQIHSEMNVGFISKQREELLWEVQRIITQLKRKLKTANKDRELLFEKIDEQHVEETTENEGERSATPTISSEAEAPPSQSAECVEEPTTVEMEVTTEIAAPVSDTNLSDSSSCEKHSVKDAEPVEVTPSAPENKLLNNALAILQIKNTFLNNLKESFLKQIEQERAEITTLEAQLSQKDYIPFYGDTNSVSLDEIMDLLQKENQILQIKKINLVRQIMEQQEECIDLKTKIDACTKNVFLT